MSCCPECGARIIGTETLTLWDHIFCQVCDVELEVIAVDGLEFESVYDFDDEEELFLEEVDEWD